MWVQVARQSLRQAQATSLPAMAAAVSGLQEQAYQPSVQATNIQVLPSTRLRLKGVCALAERSLVPLYARVVHK